MKWQCIVVFIVAFVEMLLRLNHVVYAPLGFYLRHQAWRKNVSGVKPGPLPFAWDVAKIG